MIRKRPTLLVAAAEEEEKVFNQLSVCLAIKNKTLFYEKGKKKSLILKQCQQQRGLKE